MAELRYIGPHGPNEIRKVPEKKVDEFIKSGVYEAISDNLVVDKSISQKQKLGVKKEENVKKYSFEGVKLDEEE